MGHKFKVSGIAAQTLGVFSHTAVDPETDKGGDKLIVEGKVVQRAECCPNNSTLYSKIKAEAIGNAGKPVRQMQRLDKHVKTFKPIANHAANLEHERRKKVDGKKMRDDKDEAQETRQPMAYLREILNEVCVYSVKPPHRNMWELKPEYRHYKADEEEGEGSAKKGGLDSDSE